MIPEVENSPVDVDHGLGIESVVGHKFFTRRVIINTYVLIFKVLAGIFSNQKKKYESN